MDLCSQCQKRKAKRSCPALGSPLCSLCCGRLREKELHCPAACPYLSRHKPYQENRIIQKKGALSDEVLNDERLAWLTLNIEAPLNELAEKRPDFKDRDAVLALEYAKDRVKKARPLIVLAEGGKLPMDVAGEAVLSGLNQCRFQRKIILPQSQESYTPEEKFKCLEAAILTVKRLARGNLDGRTYLLDIKRRLSRLQDASRRDKIITPT